MNRVSLRARRGIAGLDALAASAFENFGRGARQFDPVALDDRERVGTRRRIGHRRSRRDVRRTVARHVGNQQRHDLGRMTCGREPSALDRRKMPAHAIHFADRRAGPEKRLVDRLLVFERQAFERRDEQRRATAGDQAQHDIVFAEVPDRVQDSSCRIHARGIRHGMRRLDDFDS
jgi:hypothetical protein